MFIEISNQEIQQSIAENLRKKIKEVKKKMNKNSYG